VERYVCPSDPPFPPQKSPNNFLCDKGTRHLLVTNKSTEPAPAAAPVAAVGAVTYTPLPVAS
jgi:hypothetical protein